jgi:hypothetical protein
VIGQNVVNKDRSPVVGQNVVNKDQSPVVGQNVVNKDRSPVVGQNVVNKQLKKLAHIFQSIAHFHRYDPQHKRRQFKSRVSKCW